jgi:hypothetical protein
VGFEWECDEEGDLGSKCEPVELFMIRWRERGEWKGKWEWEKGAVHIIFFSECFSLCWGRDTKFQWGKI